LLQPTHPRLAKNNFDLLRLLLAITVCVSHASYLSGFHQIGIISSFLSSSVAVKSFFVISGFLIFMSFERSSSLMAYARKRMSRIYPAYFTVVMLCAILLFAVSSKSIGEYFSAEWIQYVFANLTFLNLLQPRLPGVFENNNLTDINASLWTIKIEVMFYLAVPVLVFLFRKFSRLPVLILVYCSSVAYAEILEAVSRKTDQGIYEELSRQLPGQLSYFMAGAFFYYFLPLFERHLKYFLAAAVIILAINFGFPLPLLEPIALATVVIFVGLFGYLGNFGTYGDFSYGMYILHYPIIQTILHFGWFQNNPWSFLAVAMAATTAGAIAMWHLVEKRFLGRRSHATVKNSGSENIPPSSDKDKSSLDVSARTSVSDIH
jgi:peptidoglycan/LPS O-acetylase OafA/YrhL